MRIPQSALEIRVTDTGIGIKPEDQERIFESFQQIDGSMARQYQGTGLGLALARSFVEMHGGRMWVRSDAGKGSTFTFTLPLRQGVAAGAARPIVDDAEGGEGPLILVVDDSPRAVELLGTWLRGAGYRVCYALNGDEALEKARNLRPFAITLDILLPKKHGWEVLRDLKRLPETRDIPVIVVSMVDDRELGISLGACDYLLKPIDRKVLVEKIDRLQGQAKDQQRGSRRVLAVDDDQFALEVLASTLGGKGYQVTKATSGAEALRLAAASPPDLIICDLMMPGMSGFELVQRLREDERLQEVPILIFSGAMLSDQEKAELDRFAQGIAQKTPFSSDQLLGEVRRLERLSQGVGP